MTVKQRNKLLAEMTDEVGALVLRNNYAQNTALANARRPVARPAPRPAALHAPPGARGPARPGAGVPAHRPADPRAARAPAQGLTSPELAVLLAYTKITVADELLAHRRCRTTRTCSGLLHAYFPTRAARAVPRADRRPRAAPRDHHDRAGQRHGQHRRYDASCTGCARRPAPRLEEIVRAQTAARAIFGSARSGTRSRRSTTRSTADVQTRIRLHSRRLVERGTRWLLNNRPQPLQLAETIDFFGERVAQVWAQLPKLLRGRGPGVVPADPTTS